jgi:hypothetical protein
MEGEGIRENDGGDEFNYIYCKNFYKCYSVLLILFLKNE